MSLSALRQLRIEGSKPASVVNVVVGKEPLLHERPDVIVILPGDKPAFLDWRPIVGLPVALFTVPGHELLATQTLDALQAVNARLIGSAWRNETLALEDAAKPVLHRMWEVLCL